MFFVLVLALAFVVLLPIISLPATRSCEKTKEGKPVELTYQGRFRQEYRLWKSRQGA